ncbi:helix-turn-helix domain-containing protein [Mucilaginibacter sp. JRF]|uniref:helix-turn-helix domain-containing protein n=1 Tax=Mucilaginibacter sp. JRF TaxID=2780088 RepID=UPI001D167354|nr:helix-turn-helix domain-containing protein [Mucilaginibacter sp. JRF]
MHNLPGIPLHTLPSIQFMATDTSTAFGEHSPDHRIDFYAMVWFQEDAGTHYIDFKPYPIKKDMVYMIGRNQVHSIPSLELPRAKNIVFSAEFLHRIEEPYLRQLFLPFNDNGIQIPPDMLDAFSQLFNLILLEYRGEADSNLLLTYTTALFTHLYRFTQNAPALTAEDDARMIKLVQLIEEHYRENKPADFYADKLGLTAKRVNEILRFRAGLTINRLRDQMLLIEAKRELFHRQHSIKEIAYNLGFSDQSYFARFFKKHTGISPDQFREKDSLEFIK